MGRGRTATGWHVDRIDDTRGYEAGNIQVLTNRENILKEHRRRKTLQYDFTTGNGRYIEHPPVETDSDCPF